MVGASVWRQRLRSEIRVSGTFTALAISSQPKTRGTGTAVGAKRILTCVLAQAARGGPALIHICGQMTGAGGWPKRRAEVAWKPAPSSPGIRGGWVGRGTQEANIRRDPDREEARHKGQGERQ